VAVTRLAAVVDVETTGWSPYFDEIIEIAMDLISYDPESGEILSVVDSYYGQREPGVQISPGALAVHGISSSVLKGKELDLTSIRKIVAEADFLVAHNASFDMRFVIQVLPDACAKPWLCTLRDIDWKTEGCTSHKLGALLDWFSLRIDNLHCAKSDTAALVALLRHVGADGRSFLAQLLGALPYRSIQAEQHGAALVERYMLGCEQKAAHQRAMLEDRVVLGQSRAREFELAHPATRTEDLLTYPLPILMFVGRTFVLTGTFRYGRKRACAEAVCALGASVGAAVTHDTDYLVVGSLGDKAWAYGFFGTKIEKAREQLEKGHPIAIISEDHWRNEMERVQRSVAAATVV